jgi:hypothetical protein
MVTTMLGIIRFVMVFLSLAALGGCASSENLFNTGRDARIYNPMTGRYEWPDRN